MKVTAIAAPVVCLGLLAGMSIEYASYPDAEDVAPYHDMVKKTIEQMPYEVGDWVAEDVPLPPSALALLKPNAICSRRYINRAQRLSVDLLLVHCQDARDLAGHYPPICYPANGWRTTDAEPTERQVDGWLVPATDYYFTRESGGRALGMHIANFMILPDGTIVRDMTAVRKQAADYRSHFYGAAQVQLVFSDSIGEGQRQRITQQFLRLIRPVAEAIATGVE